MAGGHMKYRHLGRSSSHRQALLRNLVTSLFIHESISTSWPKAKEAQRLAEKLITLGKKNTEASKRRAIEIFFTPLTLVPKLFGPLRERYATREGGYTRVLRIEPLKPDQAPSAILELVDGPKDMRFAMTARTIARQREEGMEMSEMTKLNMEKVTRFRPNGRESLEAMVNKMKAVNKKLNLKSLNMEAVRTQVGKRHVPDINQEHMKLQEWKPPNNAPTLERRWGGSV